MWAEPDPDSRTVDDIVAGLARAVRIASEEAREPRASISASMRSPRKTTGSNCPKPTSITSPRNL